MDITTLPHYITHYILSFFEPQSILRLMATCTHFRDFLKSERYYKYVNCGECDSLNNAFKNGHLGCAYGHEKLVERCDGKYNCRQYDEIFKQGHLHIIKWLFGKNMLIELIRPTILARYGHIDCLEYYYQNQGELSKYVLEWAIMGNQMDCINYLINKGCMDIENTEWCSHAAYQGN